MEGLESQEIFHFVPVVGRQVAGSARFIVVEGREAGGNAHSAKEADLEQQVGTYYVILEEDQVLLEIFSSTQVVVLTTPHYLLPFLFLYPIPQLSPSLLSQSVPSSTCRTSHSYLTLPFSSYPTVP